MRRSDPTRHRRARYRVVLRDQRGRRSEGHAQITWVDDRPRKIEVVGRSGTGNVKHQLLVIEVVGAELISVPDPE